MQERQQLPRNPKLVSKLSKNCAELDPPKNPEKDSKMIPKLSPKSIKFQRFVGFVFWFIVGILVQGTQDGAQVAQESAKMAQDRPKMGLTWPKISPKRPKTTQKWPKTSRR